MDIWEEDRAYQSGGVSTVNNIKLVDDTEKDVCTMHLAFCTLLTYF